LSKHPISYTIYNANEEPIAQGNLEAQGVKYNLDELTTEFISIHLTNVVGTKVVRVKLK
jgi:thiamine pyrophosphokinase